MLLKALSELNGASGAEKPVRDYLRQVLEPFADEVVADTLGNLIVRKKGRVSGPLVMLAAHMDEVALMITGITPDGLLKFRPVGGMDPRILPAKTVKVGPEQLAGVIGLKAIHLSKVQERRKSPDFDKLCIDIGAKSKEEAERVVQLGDYAYFDTEFETLGEGYFKGKALDDRIGCAVLAEVLQRDYDLPLAGVFTVQEEVGLRGAKVAAFRLEPDFAIVVEGTVSADMPEVKDRDWVTQLGQGPACSLMDKATLYAPRLVRKTEEIARRRGIPLQFRRGSSGGNDAGVIHLSQKGVPTLALSVPCRYIHSWASIAAEADFRATVELVDALIREGVQQI
ncbi:putative aminopeptidase YsdC [Peptococcaceae bacterium CEB3]|nr:putative aminopeptidase YsdC [Peptococcaceae bacterium CEB3]